MVEKKLIKTASGTDWEAFEVVRSDTARWVEDDINIKYCPYCGSKLN